MGYLIGQLGGLLPIPGGIGGVDGGLIGTLVVYGAPAAATAAAVLAYRVILFWLPLVVGGAAFAALRKGLNDPDRPDYAGRSSRGSPPSASRRETPERRVDAPGAEEESRRMHDYVIVGAGSAGCHAQRGDSARTPPSLSCSSRPAERREAMRSRGQRAAWPELFTSEWD